MQRGQRHRCPDEVDGRRFVLCFFFPRSTRPPPTRTVPPSGHAHAGEVVAAEADTGGEAVSLFAFLPPVRESAVSDSARWICIGYESPSPCLGWLVVEREGFVLMLGSLEESEENHRSRFAKPQTNRYGIASSTFLLRKTLPSCGVWKHDHTTELLVRAAKCRMTLSVV